MSIRNGGAFMRITGTGLLILALSLPLAAQRQRNGGERGVAQRLRQMDSNGDRKISRDEWKGTTKAFDLLDADKDGSIAAEEFKDARGKVRDRVRNNLRDMDKDNDSRISRREWQGRAEMFDRLDTDRDGFVTKQEIQNRPKPGRRR